MNKTKHLDFIMAPISEILIDGIKASSGLSDSISSFPICDYIFQSLFLKMTGAQEQKMKCICWDLATDDYEYRYEFLNNKKLGECSRYSEKNTVYLDLIEAIKKKDKSFGIESINFEVILESVRHLILDNAGVVLFCSFKQQLDAFSSTFDVLFKKTQLGQKNSNGSDCLFQSQLAEQYKHIVYNNRNRIAHNTFSYQQNLPDFELLRAPEFSFDNYFFRYALITLIDYIFIELYGKYVNI